MARLPDHRGRNNRNLEYLGSSDSRIEDAEWTEAAGDGGMPPQPPPQRSCLKTGAILMVGAVVALVVAFLIASWIIGAIAEPEGPPTASGATISAATERPLPLRQADLADAEIQARLCSDEMTLPHVHDVSRTWLRGVLNGMVADGVLIPPAIEDPVERMVAHANIDWIGGPPTYVEAQTVEGGGFVTCSAGIVFRDAIMLPDGSWSDAEIAIPDATFDMSVEDDSDVVRVELIVGEPDEAMDKVTITLAGATMTLAAFYDFILGT